MYTTCSELVVFMCRTGKSMNNLLSHCGLVDAKISDSEKDLPVCYSGLSEAKTTVCHLHHIVGDWPWRPCKGHFLYLNHYQATSQFFLPTSLHLASA